MESIKYQLLGIGIILIGLALYTDNILVYVVCALGFLCVLAGFFNRDGKDKDK